ncbi:hypothetical protein [Companilactobacillus muriivasis]|uniref:hypothetical protein n=1 Tax=Companilactobacillus muriivasis TaxID=3081444 RepID=UPI0030C7775E
MSLKSDSELVLKRLIQETYKDPRKREFQDEGNNIDKKVAFYLQSKGLVTLTAYYDAGIKISLNESSFSYFEDKKDKLIHNILFSFIIPIIISLITTLITIFLSSKF